MLLGLAGLTWMVRTVPLALLFMTPVIANRLGPVVGATSLIRWALAGTVWLSAGFAIVHVDTGLGVGFEPTSFPEGAVQWIERSRPQGHMWNFSPFGGYLSLRLYPDPLVFADGRNQHARDQSLVLRTWLSMSDDTAFDALVTEYDMQFAVIGAREGQSFGAPLARSSRWAMVYFDDVAAVYVRTDGPNAQLASAGYRVLRHLTSYLTCCT